MSNTILIVTLLTIFYGSSNETPIFKLDTGGLTSKDGVDRSFRKGNVADDSPSSSVLVSDSKNSSSRDSNVGNISNQNKSAESEIEIKKAEVERKDVFKLNNQIIFSSIHRTEKQVDYNKEIHSETNINESQVTDAGKPIIIELVKTASKSQRSDNDGSSVTTSIALKTNADAKGNESFQRLNNSEQGIMPDTAVLTRNRRRARLRKGASFLSNGVTDFDIGLSRKERNDKRREIKPENDPIVKMLTEKLKRFHSRHHIKIERNQLKRSVLSSFKLLFKRSALRRSRNNKKSPRMIFTKNVDRERRHEKDRRSFKTLVAGKSKENKEENTQLSNLFENRFAFKNGADFAALKKKDVYLSDIPQKENSIDLDHRNEYRYLVKKDTDLDVPNFDLSHVLFNVDKSELQSYGADIVPEKKVGCGFMRDNKVDQQKNIPAQLKVLHISHHITSETKCPDNIESTLDNAKIYTIKGFDFLAPKKELDYFHSYGKKKTHTSEELQDVFNQVELEVLGLDDDSNYQTGLLKNYTESEVDDIFKKLYFDIFDIDQPNSPPETHAEDESPKDQDRVFKKLDENTDDDGNAYDDESGGVRLGYNDGRKACPGVDGLACQNMLDALTAEDNRKAFGKNRDRNNYNSIDFSGIDANGVMHGIELRKPVEGTGNTMNEVSFFITQDCFENITQNKDLSVDDIMKAQINCTDTHFSNDINKKKNNKVTIDVNQKAEELYEKASLVSTQTAAKPQTTTIEIDNQQDDWNETAITEVESYETSHVNDSNSANASLEYYENLPENNITTNLTNGEPDDWDPNYRLSSTTSASILSSLSEHDNEETNKSIKADKTPIVSHVHIAIKAHFGHQPKNSEPDETDDQKKENPTRNEEQALQISVKTKCETNMGKRSHGAAHCLKNKPPAKGLLDTIKGTTEKSEIKGDIIIINDNGARNVTRRPKPRKVIHKDGGINKKNWNTIWGRPSQMRTSETQTV